MSKIGILQRFAIANITPICYNIHIFIYHIPMTTILYFALCNQISL